jgi:RNA-dependent RNA polymerase
MCFSNSFWWMERLSITNIVIYQFELFSYLGMVCLDVASQILNPDVGLYLRPSMNKFDSKNKSIDIVRVSSMPSAGFLNREIILLLSSLGIDDDIFFQMQEEMLNQLNAITVDHQRARDFLNRFGGSSGNGYHAFLLEYLKRFGRQIDPFAGQILMAFQAFLVKELRTKARILVPNTWFLFGVADETRTLKYGEVFIQIEQKNTSGNIVSKIITGSVVVTRNPCFHPGKMVYLSFFLSARYSFVGDIRRLKAIDVPALHQLKNVIVFPMHGPRSHPAEMAGGDLDGDTFWVSHEQKLLFNENEEPFDYHDQATEDAERMELSRDTVYTINDVCNFFVEYIEADK